MIVQCPSCATRYRLPEHLVGAAGARVNCPRCATQFRVDEGGAVVATAVASEPPASATAPAPAAPAAPVVPLPAATPPVAAAGDGPSSQSVAHELVEGFLLRCGPALEEARARGAVFAEWGSTILDLFDEYRRRAGTEADPAEFRRALRDRVGVEIPDPHPR